jgi:phosphoribosyl 1,2-cyclic phosphodiesterase
MHTSLLILYRGKKIMIDCGTSWERKLNQIKPDHILLTHAHPDHAFGLKKGAPCPVWATKETWKSLKNYPIKKKQVLLSRKPKRIEGIRFEAFPVWHSILCPAIGYRIVCGRLIFFYVPDVAYIPNIEVAFKKIQFYIGDGATIVRSMIRKNKNTGEIFGHATVRQQLTWCRKQKVPKMIITHCGSQIVSKEKNSIQQIEAYAKQRGVAVQLAYDNLELKFQE